MSLNEIKGLHNLFQGLNSCCEFLDYIKTLIQKNKLTIKKENNKISINIIVEYLFKELLNCVPFSDRWGDNEAYFQNLKKIFTKIVYYLYRKIKGKKEELVLKIIKLLKIHFF